jgi:predicted dienelactone hydrolase
MPHLVLLALAGLALLSPTTTHAAPACLAPEVSHTDRRDLSALRGTAEGACPCASFTSSRDHRRCTGPVLRAALDTATVRPECRREAKRALRRATCGTDKVACGLVKEPAGEFRKCAVRRAQRCTSRPTLTAAPCANLSHCADVSDWSAGTCIDVRANGPFDPGARVITFTKDSVAAPGTPRALETTIWYPAPPGSGPLDASARAVLDAPVDPSGGPYPVVMFSHGSCGYSRQSLFLTPFLASHGFVVVAPPHPGNTVFEFPTCGTPAAQVASAQERPQDIVHVLDAMLALNGDGGSPFFGALDPARIGMMGHSFGGLTTYLVSEIDPRIQVAIPLAPATLGAPPLAVPSLTVLGDLDSVVNNAAALAVQAAGVTPKLLAVIEHAGHYAFSDLCFPGPDCSPPTTLVQDEAHRLVRRVILPYLAVNLAGNDVFRPFLQAPGLPGITLDADP